MKFNSEDDAKKYADNIMIGHIQLHEAEHLIDRYKSYQESAHNLEDKEFWRRAIQDLDDHINSDELKEGKYPKGINTLIIEMIDWRAAMYAFQHAESSPKPFQEHAFYAQWFMGGTYVIFCILGKLVSKHSQDKSLRRLWTEVSHYIKCSGLCSKDEVEIIDNKMQRTEGHFTNQNSSMMRFRNKVIAHNEGYPIVKWVEIDEDIKLLCRIWALITMWSSIGITEPFRPSQQAFSGLDSIFTPLEIRALSEQHNIYIEKVESWCTHSLVDNSKVSKRSPFRKISVSTEVH
ncbi:MAG TPA: hypothetical protein DCS49_00905 [Gammaproteobacteria bacterium]|nr:hypothetical protein [Gammaproteobacteria bacterium]